MLTNKSCRPRLSREASNGYIETDSDEDSDDNLGDLADIVAFDEDELVAEKSAASLQLLDPELKPFPESQVACLAEYFRKAMLKEEDYETNLFRAAQASNKGLRRSMEERTVIVKRESLGFCAVYDGHNGSNIAEYAGQNLHLLLWKELENGKVRIAEALRNVSTIGHLFKAIEEFFSHKFVPLLMGFRPVSDWMRSCTKTTSR